VDQSDDSVKTTGLFSGKKNLKKLYEQATQEMYKRNLELAETNQTLTLLRIIDKLVLQSHDKLNVLCQAIADSILEHSSLATVAVLAIPAHRDKLELLGFATSFDQLKDFKYQVVLDDHDPWIVAPDLSTLIDLSSVSDENISRILNIGHDKAQDLRQASPMKSLMLGKLLARHRIVGVMAVGFVEEAAQVSEKQKAAVERLCEAVGIAIENNLLFEENQYVLRKLQKTNEKLKIMDETKDEFISMASHQLRTPLTSVKGYLSMVLEGDVGEVSDSQRKLLDQAFVSSQRMVYLIADLLNVSRLKTGKFIIDAAPTNLAEVVEGEVSQLREQAKLKNIALKYDKPKEFPELMLDETKTRQVIMNFVDNALYYTPSGGNVDITLQEDRSCIYFRVQDNGLGVPKDEKKHLFAKFYRAKNARKARPDGTGLGLFMAKKVITAQGGDIIFDSEEGKGSTFGFSFNKKHLALPEK
jgi:signal transduction histidine kinase